MRTRRFISCFACIFALGVSTLGAQESSSRGDVSAPVSGPSLALRDALGAACSHDEVAFKKFLSARNAESFSRLTVSARTELMKRFVLLSDPGKPAMSANPAGRPTVSCATPFGTAEIQLGGADTRDAIAFIPVDLREASDPDTGAAHHILFGMVREDGQWKVLSIGLLLLDLPSLEIEWDQAEISSSEQQALESLKAIARAIETYRRSYARIPESLLKLNAPQKGEPTPEAAGLLGIELASGRKNGYTFRYVIVGANDVGAPAQYELSATPSIYGRTGKTSFFRDTSGAIHAGDHQGAIGSNLDPKVN
ncbi:MAG: hypothetical protein JSS69_06680 [Acidobacteria bacterium]|nr:hypothetical protein [Acidobacteriota bacterium]MBS1865588.1 hypothetical protein [Acidobacteriota bacterium]